MGMYMYPSAREIAEEETAGMSSEYFAGMMMDGFKGGDFTPWSYLAWTIVQKVPEWVWDDFLTLLRAYLEEYGVTGGIIRRACMEYKIDDILFDHMYTGYDIDTTKDKVKMFNCIMNVIPSADSTALCKWIYSCSRKEYKEKNNYDK